MCRDLRLMDGGLQTLLYERVRSFVAVDIGEQDLIDQFVEVQDSLIRTGGDLRLVQPQNIHLTIRFLGEVSLPLIEEVKSAMTNVAFRRFKTRLKGVGTFPSVRRPNVVWIGIVQGIAELGNIHSQLEPRLRSIGLPPDNKGFSPHITIARVRSGKNQQELSRAITEMSEVEIGTMDVTAFELRKSTLTPQGPIYSTLFKKQSESS